MRISVENLENSKVKLSVTLTKDEFQNAYDKALDKILENVEIKGFRKGKVPKNIYLSRYGEGSVYKDAVDVALNDSYFEALSKKKIADVSQPEIDIDYESMGLGKTFKYTAIVEVYPEVELGQYFGVEVEKLNEEVTEEDINDFVKRDRLSKAELEILEDGTVENGHTVVFDFEGSVDGVKFEGGSAENYSLEIGSGRFIPGFEEQMIGMKVDEEKVVKVTFPEEYQAKDLAGKPADFKVKIHEIKKRVLPELTDEFVKDLEIENVNTVDEYKKYAADRISQEKKEAAANKFTDDVVETVCANAKVNIPNAMVERRIQQMLSQVENQAKSYGLEVEQFLSFQGVTLEQYKEVIKVPAEKSVLESLVLEKIANVEKIGVGQKDFEERYQELALSYGKTIDEIKVMFPENQILPYFLNLKTIDLLKEKAVLK